MSELKMKSRYFNNLLSRMEIKLQNFRCHRESSFSLPETGLVLISGASGKGKTSLLNAISYALFGEIRRPYTYGENTCKVSLTYKGMNITRTSKPTRLLLEYNDVEYEDDPAQKIIEGVLGMNYKEFLASSYVVQRRNNSVLSMSPHDQLQFVERLAFSQDEHIKYRERFKQNVKKKQEEKIRKETELSSLRDHLKTIKTNVPEVSDLPPLDSLGSLKEIAKAEKVLTRDLSNAKESLEKLQNELQKIRSKEKDSEEIKREIQSTEMKIASLEEMRSKIGPEITSKELEKLENEVEDLRTLYNQTKAYEEYLSDSKRIKKLEKDHVSTLKKEIRDLEKTIPSKKEFSDLKKEQEDLETLQKTAVELESQHKQRKQAIVRFGEVQRELGLNFKSSKKVIENIKKRENDLLVEIDETKKVISEHQYRVVNSDIEKIVYECPSCSTKLRVRGKDLIIDTNVKSSSQDFKKLLADEEAKLKDFTSQLHKFKLLIQELEQLQLIISKKLQPLKTFNLSTFRDIEKRVLEIEKNQKTVDELKEQVRGNVFPNSIQELHKELKIKKAKFPSRFKPSKSSENVEKELKDSSKVLDDKVRRQAERLNLTREINGIKKKLKVLKSRSKDQKIKRRDSSKVEAEIEKCQTKLSETAEKFLEVSRSREYLRQYEELNQISRVENKVKKATSSLLNAEDQVKGALGLQEAGKEAEMKAISQTISSINEHAKIYLDRMFDDEIQVRLENYRLTKTKTVKAQMNVVVNYKNNDYESFNDLSAGEKQRCELAFLLAVHDMLGSSIVLLDECLNNLDGENHMNLLMELQNLVKDKLILVVSHQAVKGNFDKEINI